MTHDIPQTWRAGHGGAPGSRWKCAVEGRSILEHVLRPIQKLLPKLLRLVYFKSFGAEFVCLGSSYLEAQAI